MDRNWIFRILGIVVNFALLYIVGAFIAWDANPLHWWIITSTLGRVLFMFFAFANVAINLSENLSDN